MQRAVTDPVSLLSVSVVVYRSEQSQLERTLERLAHAIVALKRQRGAATVALYLVNNGRSGALSAVNLPHQFLDSVDVIEGHGNIGYGRGHNLAIARARSQYHLILNPDIDLATDALTHAVTFMDGALHIALLTPRVLGPDGQQQYLCRRYPSVLDLALRAFAPAWVKRLARRRLDHYEMRDVIGAHVVTSVTIASGCFMLFRTANLKQLGGFDPAFFLYFEDYDLSLRSVAAGAPTAYVPDVEVVHFGGDAARKGLHHIRLFAVSGARFFHRHGWRLF